jgi:hypothetical protein
VPEPSTLSFDAVTVLALTRSGGGQSTAEFSVNGTSGIAWKTSNRAAGAVFSLT